MHRAPNALLLTAALTGTLAAPSALGASLDAEREIASVSASASAAPGQRTADDPYRRLGDESRMVTIRTLETKPFDFAKLANLQGWAETPLDEEAVGGRLLVLLAWDQGDAKSVRLLPTLARLQRTMGDNAVFAAVHTQQGWEEAADKIEAGRVPIPAAHDADGSFYKLLRADDHPNLYIIDRAGNIRVADLDPRDLTKAVASLARETPEEAAGDLPRRIELLAQTRRLVPDAPDGTAPAGPDGDRPVLRPPGTPSDRSPSDKAVNPRDPDRDQAPVVRPPASAYSAARWPSHNRDTTLNALNVQGRPLPVAIGQENWLTEKPATPVADHVQVLDFWATWCGPCLRASPLLNDLQQRHRGELLVMAMSGQSAGSSYPEDERAIRRHIRSHPVTYSHLHDPAQRVYRALQIRAIPHVVVLSTDGVVRWQGNPLSPDFQRTVARVIEADPLLAAKRAQQMPDGESTP